MGPPDPTQPYNDLPRLPPGTDLESKAVLKRCIGARAALAELKQAGTLLPNQAMLINTIPVLEAQASSEIENVVTTSDRLFRAIGQGDSTAVDPATKEALRYGSALRRGFLAIARRPLSTVTATEICAEIKGVEMEVRRVPGTQLRNDKTGEVVYTPPVGADLLRDLMANWEVFMHDPSDLDPLVRMAVLHYQFEAIHPFTDGNGRTGRILNLLFLVAEGLLELPVLYLSAAINRTRETYYRLLAGVTRAGEWAEWVLYMVGAVEEAALWTTAKIRDIHAQMELASEHIRLHRPGIHSRELVEQIFIQPYCRIANLVEAGVARRQTASNYLNALTEIGVLVPKKVGREKLFIHPALLELLIGTGGASAYRPPLTVKLPSDLLAR
ncbi:protein adenylyltransferase Fic [Zavarzinia sp.]|uniref:protein adenylyltransferase Fic n=1 Tax=Zavarzinia sp. TaxID=2027920 RepID=UPI0035697726